MQDFASWVNDNNEKSKGSAKNYTGGACGWFQGSWDYSPQTIGITIKPPWIQILQSPQGPISQEGTYVTVNEHQVCQ